jgi:threonine synthase
LPVSNPENIITLGEGGTPVFPLNAKINGLEKPVLVKEEGLNPTGSFKARGMSVAISKAKEFGIGNCITPSAGNAGVAMSAYCARANIRSTVVFPSITPKIYIDECKAYGAEVLLVDGLISECSRKVMEINSADEYFDVSTLKEPYRIEGKKTMGYEIAETLNWTLPDVIVYPTGGGTGLIGIWKAFHEMKQLGWIECALPKMVAVQSETCSPVVDTWENKAINPSHYQASIALGLNVPNPFGVKLIMQCLKESGGTAVTVSEAEIHLALKVLNKKEGILVSPEGASAFAGVTKLVASGFLKPSDQILILNTGNGMKHLVS